jgi:CheY-like chemotaxis protein
MKKILVVDDNEVFAETLKIGLKRKGFKVDTANNGIEALKQLKENNYNTLLTDVQMPEINGIELAYTVSKEYPDIEIILMSGYAMQDECEPFELISKPFIFHELEELLEN